MSVYLQFDSSARTDPFIETNLGNSMVWVPNDNYPNAVPFNVYQANRDLIQTPTNYRVFYRELNDANNIRTIGFLAHCKEQYTNLNFSVESCVLVMPANGLLPRINEDGDTTYVSILDEPYLYVRMMPINHAEGNLIYSNNPSADDATFIMWCDKVQPGTDGSPPIVNSIQRPNPLLPVTELNTARWIIYKSCMITVMRLDLEAQEWQIRIYDRFGNDVILGEADNNGSGFPEQPAIDPDLQTTILVGIKPNYPL
jgi:hypothetical protein